MYVQVNKKLSQDASAIDTCCASTAAVADTSAVAAAAAAAAISAAASAAITASATAKLRLLLPYFPAAAHTTTAATSFTDTATNKTSPKNPGLNITNEESATKTNPPDVATAAASVPLTAATISANVAIAATAIPTTAAFATVSQCFDTNHCRLKCIRKKSKTENNFYKDMHLSISQQRYERHEANKGIRVTKPAKE